MRKKAVYRGASPGGKKDPVSNPAHYTAISPSPIQVIEAYGLGFCDGNVIKYVLRAPMKNGLEDLKKALWYLTRHIENQEKKRK